MSKVEAYSNYRLVVYPALWRSTIEKNHPANAKTCNDLEKSILRHCDDVDSISVEWDSVYVCSDCGWTWEVDENGEPMCCQKAADEWKAAQQANTQEE